MDYYDYNQKGHKISINDILDLIDMILESETKRHIVGGALLSVSFLFGGLAITAMTTRKEGKNELESQTVGEDIRS